jgi:KUP system potassium uptake protein
MGQIYVPQVNWALMMATVLIVIGFGSSGAVASAYGIAVTLTMVITVTLLYVVMTERWHWRKPAAIAFVALFLAIDLAFFGANALKLLQGGWVTLAVALLLFTIFATTRSCTSMSWC